MENYNVLAMDVIIRTDELEKHKDADVLRKYLDEVVAPGIINFITNQPKGWEVGGSCSSDRGCQVSVGGSIRF
jgi:hypothetical protein